MGKRKIMKATPRTT